MGSLMARQSNTGAMLRPSTDEACHSPRAAGDKPLPYVAVPPRGIAGEFGASVEHRRVLRRTGANPGGTLMMMRRRWGKVGLGLATGLVLATTAVSCKSFRPPSLRKATYTCSCSGTDCNCGHCQGTGDE